jgi:hypothetical protein
MEKLNAIILDKGEDNFITVSTIGKGGKVKNLSINANIKVIQRISDNAVFIANPNIKQTCGNLSFYILGFWYNDACNCFSVYGKYSKNDNYTSVNICSTDSLIKEY